MKPDLWLFRRPNSGEPFAMEITPVARDWSRSIAAMGGHKLGTFSASEETLSSDEMTDWFNDYLGCVVQETCYGIESWQGLVWEMHLIQAGVEYVRTLDPAWFKNRVKVMYTDDSGASQSIAYLSNADSLAEYGRCDWIEVMGGGLAVPMAQRQAALLLEYGWPRSRQMGTIELPVPPSGRPDGLYVTVAGFWATLGWRYYETSLTAQAGAWVDTLRAASEWITAKRLEANTMSVYLDCSIPKRLADALREITEQGDAAGNVWRCGVYGRGLVYEPVPVTVTHSIQDGRLVDAAGGEVVPWLLEPGFLLRNASAPTGGVPAGTSSLWDDPRNVYVPELEVTAGQGEQPDVLRLLLPDQSAPLTVMYARQEAISK